MATAMSSPKAPWTATCAASARSWRRWGAIPSKMATDLATVCDNPCNMARGLRIHILLLGANAFVLMVPIFAVLALRIYDTYLLRQTERQLIAQSIAIAEIFRELWLKERGLGAAVPDFRPPGK